MERVNKICSHPLWRESADKIEELEQDRIFCRHSIAHFQDVARIAYIENLEKNLGFSKELIYAAAMLHDIGRHLQYLEGIPHDKGSAMLAEKILSDCAFEKAEQEEILSAILQHRTSETKEKDDFAGLLYRADKKSRSCLFCPVCGECNWSEEKKNLTLLV